MKNEFKNFSIYFAHFKRSLKGASKDIKDFGPRKNLNVSWYGYLTQTINNYDYREINRSVIE